MNSKELYTLGIDIGSTTVKIAILDNENEVLFSDYERHFANIQETLSDLLGRAIYKLGPIQVSPVITGSGGLTLAKHLGVPFVQEVIAVSTALQDYAPQTDVAIELGGEDAKIIYFEGGNVEQRMNGVCAGGTGSFIDQMASLLQTDASGLNEYAKNYFIKNNIVLRDEELILDAIKNGAKVVLAPEDGYPAADQRWCCQRRPCCIHFPGGCQPDDQRTCLRKTDPWTCRFPGRTASFPFRTERSFHPYTETG